MKNNNLQKFFIIACLCLVVCLNKTFGQTKCIQGPINIVLGQTVNFNSFSTAQCANCYDWDINNDSTSSDNSIVGTLQIVGTDNQQIVSIKGVALGTFSIQLTYFIEKGGCITCTYEGKVVEDTCWKDVSVGGGHVLGLKSDGTLWSWGLNNQGQLGLNDISISDKNVPTLVNADTNWSKVSAANHSVAIKTNGTLWAWGDDNYGQLGDGANTDRIAPYQIGTDTNWKEISAGMGHTLAIKTDGSLWAWGLNSTGQLGDGTTVSKNTPIRIGLANNWQKICSLHGHSIALKTDGTLWTWGWNAYGQLGDGTTVNKLVPTQVGVDFWKEIGGSWYTTNAIKATGTLWGWGGNNYGQLGDGTNVDKSVPTQIGTDVNWLKISKLGDFHELATKTNGTLWAWGANHEWWSGGNMGQLGDGTYIDRNAPVQVGTQTNWNIVSAGGVNSASIKFDGVLSTWGFGDFGGLGNGTYVSSNTPIALSCPQIGTPRMNTTRTNTAKILTTEMYINKMSTTSAIKIFPNPTKTSFTIQLQEDVIQNINIFDSQGLFIESKKISDNPSTQIDISSYKKGIYLIEIHTKKGDVQREKIIKE